jgi:acyl transferase domain-containing protein/phosphopantetheinyl transferase
MTSTMEEPRSTSQRTQAGPAGTTPSGNAPVCDVAIIGMACMFPGAGNLTQFWRNIVSKVDAITDPPPEAWDSDIYYERGSTSNDRVYCKKGGFLGPLAYFDPLAHGVMPSAAQGGEPDQWLALQVARDALADAGYPDGPGNGRQTAVILGKGTYLNRGNLTMVQHGLVVDQMLQAFKRLHPDLTGEELQVLRADLKRNLPRFDTETAGAMVPNVVAGRIANRLDLMGPSYTVDAACASSLVALDIAARGLAHGEYDMALVGGMQINTPVPTLTLFCQLNALSAREQIRPFDELADGTLLSEGIGIVILKRRADAERDGDRIYAVIKGVGVASDGRAVSVLAPRVEGEELAVRRAFDAARLDPTSIGLVEAHGTATLVGDAVEIEALTRVFGTRRRALPSCAIGSVKSMIGHTMPAAGVAGLIKAALALYHKVLPPTLNVDRPSPRLEIEKTPFYINTEARPWIHGSVESPRRAGLNAFGFGGINAHVILEEHEAGGEPIESSLEWDSEVCLVRGSSRAEMLEKGRRIRDRVRARPEILLKDLAFTLNAGIAEASPSTLAIVASNAADFERKLARALDRLADPRCVKIKEASGIYYFEEPLARQGKLAFLFPGEGAQYPDMLAQLCLHFPEVRACFDEMDRLFAEHERGYVLSDLVFPAPPFTEEERRAAEERLWQMDVSVEALYTANSALLRLLTALGIRPDAIVGHSTGEYSAMRAAGMLDERAYEQRQRELNAVYERARRDGTAPADARLFAVGAGREQVAVIASELEGSAYVAMDNCPHQVVLAASAESAERVAQALRQRNLLYETLRFDRAYHTPLFESYTLALADALNAWIVAPPQVPMYSCTTADRFPDDLAAARELALDHWVRPVEFRRTIERMYADGVRLFVEVGPRGNLTAFIDDILAPRPYVVVAANVTRRSALAQLHHVVALLAAHGVPMQLDMLYRRRSPAVVSFDEEPAGEPKRKRSARLKIATGWPSIDLSEETAARVRGALALRAGGDGREEVAPTPSAAVEATVAATASSRAVAESTAVAESRPVARATERETAGPATVVMPGVASGAATALETYFDTMERFLDVEQQLLEAGLEAGDTPAVSVPPPTPYPLIHDIVQRDGGERLVAICDVSLSSCPFLRDHTLGRDVSVADPDLTGLPVMPLTMTMEMMAEAASLLVPGLRLVGMRDVRAHRWLALDTDARRIEIAATRNGEDTVYVRVQEADGDAQAKPIAEGMMKFAAAYPVAPAVTSFTLKRATGSQWTPDRLYPEAMFHGPMFQGVASMDRLGEDGATATLRILPRDGLFDTGAEPKLVTDPVLLDQPGQVVGFWTVQRLQRGFLIFPFLLEALDIYEPPAQPGLKLTCLARITLEGEHLVRSDLDVVDRRGRVHARFAGWTDRRFDLPRSVYRFLLSPRDVAISDPWPAALAASPARDEMVACRLDSNAFPAEFFTAHGGIWQKVLAAIALTTRERDQWRALKLPPLRRLEWLLGRIAAKDAVRQYLRDRFGIALCPADVEILPDTNGRPTAAGVWATQVPARPVVSLSHTGGIAVAVVADGNVRGNVGVDLEQVGRVTEPVERLAFTSEERELLQMLGSEGDRRWPVRLWCAKEAVAKARGEGFVRGPRSFVVRDIDPASGAVHVGLERPATDEPATAVAFTACEGNLVVATSVLHG